jgi:DNA polymerase III delta prime subunit
VGNSSNISLVGLGVGISPISVLRTEKRFLARGFASSAYLFYFYKKNASMASSSSSGINNPNPTPNTNRIANLNREECLGHDGTASAEQARPAPPPNNPFGWELDDEDDDEVMPAIPLADESAAAVCEDGHSDNGLSTSTLTLPDDPTTTNRAPNCMERLFTDVVHRDYGVDLRATIFGCPSTIEPDKQNSLAANLKEKELKDTEQRIINVHKLNAGQSKAALKTFTASLTLIFGPPGTGKTTTVIAAAHEHVMLGRKVIYTCPSNGAVDAAVSAFMKQKEKEVNAVRLVGGYKSPQDIERLHQDNVGKAVATDDTKDELWDEMSMSAFELAAQANPETLLHVQKQKAIEKWSRDVKHDLHASAREYLAAQAQSSQSGPAHYTAAKRMKSLDLQLSDHFFCNEVDIVFTTCASSCHDSLAPFKPRVAIVDSADQATISGACMAVEQFKGFIETLILAGDPRQLMPVVTTKTANESLFHRMINDPNKRFEHELLTVHYRCHPDIISWVSLQFYDAKLESLPSVKEGNALQRTVKEFFRQLNVAYNGRVRMGIDCSGPGVVAKPYAATQSPCNEEEARIIVGLIKKLLQFVPPSQDERGRAYGQVRPEGIGIITPYKGQLRLIRSMLQSEGLSTRWAQVATQGSLSTTWGIQGSEVPIAFISLCAGDCNDAVKKLKFIAQPNALNVQNSRGKYFQVTTGNFRAWCNAINNDALGHGIKIRALSAFRGLIKHHYQHNDIVSWRDIDDVFFSSPAKTPIMSYFKTTDVPTLVTDSKKRPIELPVLDLQDSRKSKRALKKMVKQAKHRAAASALGTDPDVPAEDEVLPIRTRREPNRS